MRSARVVSLGKAVAHAHHAGAQRAALEIREIGSSRAAYPRRRRAPS